MRHVVQRPAFRDDLRRLKRGGRNFEDLKEAVDLLALEGALIPTYRPHRLRGRWKGLWECHIEPDWLLIYEVTEREVILMRTGTHADLFG